MTERNNLAKISKIAIATFILYVFWLKYVYGERVIIVYITGAVAIGCMTVDMLRNNDNFMGVFPYGVAVNIIMCAYSVITGIFVAKNPGFMMTQLKSYLSYSLICMAICYVVFAEKSIDWLANILVFVSVLCCIRIFTHGYYNELYGYVLSSDNNPHSLGLVLDMGIFGVAYTHTKKNAWQKAISYGLIGMFLYVIVGCGSRKCLIAAIIITIIWIIPQIRMTMSKANTTVRTGIILAIIAVTALGIFYFRHYYIHSISYGRMQLLGDATNERGSSAKREYYYRTAFELFLESPFFGVGFDQFRFNNIHGLYSHSTYAEAIASWGFIGCMLYFPPVGVAVVKTVRMAYRKQGSYVTPIVLALLAMEIFLGIGQIWFYTVEHLIAWTLIFLTLKIQYEGVSVRERKCKYVKD